MYLKCAEGWHKARKVLSGVFHFVLYVLQAECQPFVLKHRPGSHVGKLIWSCLLFSM